MRIFILGAGEIGKAVALASLILAHEKPVIHVDIVHEFEKPVDFSKLKLASNEIPLLPIGAPLGEERGIRRKRTLLLVLFQLPFACISTPNQDEEIFLKKLSREKPEEIALRITSGIIPTELIEEMSLREYFPTEERIVLSQEIGNTTPRCGNAQKFNNRRTRHPP